MRCDSLVDSGTLKIVCLLTSVLTFFISRQEVIRGNQAWLQFLVLYIVLLMHVCFSSVVVFLHY